MPIRAPSITPAPHRLSAARWGGLRVGLLGGSFNPAHAGHMHIAKAALIRFRLHAVWWVVSPGNPLKTKSPRGDLAQRVAAAQTFITHPRMVATGIEGSLDTRYTYDTLEELRRLFPRTAFVWIAGMDNACAFEQWDRWADLPQIVPFVFFDRPPAGSKIKGKRVRGHKGLRQCTKASMHTLKPQEKGVYWMLRGRAINLSSTTLRASKKRGA